VHAWRKESCEHGAVSARTKEENKSKTTTRNSNFGETITITILVGLSLFKRFSNTKISTETPAQNFINFVRIGILEIPIQ
jgi:poly(A) polymerase Pap1